jgi:hypothetical protein
VASGTDAEQVIAAEIAAITGEPPEHEPSKALLPSGGVADFWLPGAALDVSGDLLIEVKSLQDVGAAPRPWDVDYVLNHPHVPSEWEARQGWSSAGERRIRRLGMEPGGLTSRAALTQLVSVDRLRGIARSGGEVYDLSAEAVQIAVMVLFGSGASLGQGLRWPARAVATPFPGVVSMPLAALAVADYTSNAGRRGVGDDIRASLARKFAGYDGADVCLAVVVSDAYGEDSWRGLLDATVGYPLDGSPPVLHV